MIFNKIPTMVIVRSELSKAGHQYFTFLSEEGYEYLKDYLEGKYCFINVFSYYLLF